MAGQADKVAKLAAALFHGGNASSLSRAVEVARDQCGGVSPSMATVRRHLEALEQSEMGMATWGRARRDQRDAIVELLHTIAFIEADSVCYVVGRAAEGYVDECEPVRIRVVGGHVAAIVADHLEQQGFPPCEVSSLPTVVGTIAVVHLVDGPLRADLLVLPDTPAAHAPQSLVDGRQIALVDEAGFRQLLEGLDQPAE
jgi:hypothetical protein